LGCPGGVVAQVTYHTRDFCMACRMPLDAPDRIERHNVACAETGERSYTAIVNVRPRTTKADHVAQGSGVKAREAYPL